MPTLDTRECIPKRNMDLELFKILSVSKIIVDNVWKQIVSEVKVFVPRMLGNFMQIFIMMLSVRENFHIGKSL